MTAWSCSGGKAKAQLEPDAPQTRFVCRNKFIWKKKTQRLLPFLKWIIIFLGTFLFSGI